MLLEPAKQGKRDLQSQYITIKSAYSSKFINARSNN